MTPLPETAEQFIQAYEAALATQEWDKVAPLIDDGATVIFSDGTLLRGNAAIGAAYRRIFDTIEGEVYRMAEVHWNLNGTDSAAYTIVFERSGRIAGKPASGKGRGTAVLRRAPKGWVLLTEHLGPFA